MPTLVDAMPVPIYGMSLPVPTEVLHALLAQGRLVTDLPADDISYDSWGRTSEAQQYVPPPPYTATELEQPRYGIMTTNSLESFNRIFTRVRSLPMSRIVEFSFHKCNEYFVKRWELAQRNIAE